jgi:hypothetical protein
VDPVDAVSPKITKVGPRSLTRPSQIGPLACQIGGEIDITFRPMIKMISLMILFKFSNSPMILFCLEFSACWVRLHTPISAARTSAAADRPAVRAHASIARSTSRASLAMNTAKHDADANIAYPTPAESAAVLKRDLPDNSGFRQIVFYPYG